MYANDAHEGALLIGQEGRRVGGVLLAAGIPASRVDEIIETLCPAAGIQPEAIVLVGERPPDDLVRAYRDRGLRWRLWDPYQDNELVFVGALAQWEGNGIDLRIDLRAPVTLGGSLTCRGSSQFAKVMDLSRTGARLEVETCLPPGRQVGLEIDCVGSLLSLRAFVRWSRGAQDARRDGKVMGMGLEFLRPSRTAKRQLDATLELVFDAYRLDPRREPVGG